MAEESKWLRRMGHVADSLTILAAIPTAAALGLAAFIGALIAQMGLLSALLVLLFVFVAILWSGIGLLWLFDRVQQPARLRALLVDCTWALRVNSIYLNHAIGNPKAEWQIFIRLHNVRNMPIKVDTLEKVVLMEHRSPDVPLELSGIPTTLAPGGTCIINFPAYSPGMLPNQGSYTGDLDVKVRYGYADGPYTRLMGRKFQFQVHVPPVQPDLNLPVFPALGQFQANFTPREEDRDDPSRDNSFQQTSNR